MYADLHVHSTFSDGTDTPGELLRLAAAHGLRVLAITDHDSVQGVSAALALPEAERCGVALLSAIEVSTLHNRRFLHVLGYGVDIESPALSSYLTEVSRDKTENTRINFENARSAGAFAYRWERVLALNPGQSRLSGVHVVAAMRQDGVLPQSLTYRELFWEYFRPEGASFIQTEKATGYDAVDIIKKSGGVPVIAHPKLVENDALVLDLIRYGAQGIEVYYPLHTPQETQKYLQMAQDKGVMVTGGSDWHGGNSGPDVTAIGCAGLPSSDFPILQCIPPLWPACS